MQATAQIAKTEPGTQLSVTSLQPVHISPEVSQTHIVLCNTNNQVVTSSAKEHQSFRFSNLLTCCLCISQLIIYLVEPAFAGFQLLPGIDMAALVRDNYLEECQLLHEIEQPECLFLASGDSMQESYSKPLCVPLDLLQYNQSLYLLSVCAETEIDSHPAVTSSGPEQQQLQPATASFQVGQGHEGDFCFRVKGSSIRS